jgi:N utilization substance protein A
MFEEELDVDETLSQLLVAEGFSELEEVAYIELAELATIEGFDEELAEELQNRANEALERREEAARELRRELGVEDALAELPHLTEAMLVTLGKAGIKTLDDLADLATDELIAKKRGVEQRRRNKDGERPERNDRRDRGEKAESNAGGVLGEYGLNEEQGNEIIMAARAHWFDDEPAGEGPQARRPPMRTPRNDRLSDKDDATQTGREKTPGRDAQSATRGAREAPDASRHAAQRG